MDDEPEHVIPHRLPFVILLDHLFCVETHNETKLCMDAFTVIVNFFLAIFSEFSQIHGSPFKVECFILMVKSFLLQQFILPYDLR